MKDGEQLFLVSRLSEYDDFTLEAIAEKIGSPPITLESVRAAEKIEDHVSIQDRTADYHLGRIHYLMFEPGDEPIEIDSLCYANVITHEPFLVDGNHRFAAALLAKRTHVLCTFGGYVRVALYLEGKSDIKPSDDDEDDDEELVD